MAEKKSQPPKKRELIHETAIHHSREVSGPVDWRDLEVSGRATDVATQVRRFTDESQISDAKAELGKIVNNVLDRDPDRDPVKDTGLKNIGEVRRYLSRVDSGLVIPTSSSYVVELRRLYADVADGVAIATISNLSSKGGELVSGDSSKVQRTLGIDNEIVGIEDMIVNSRILDPRLRARLEMMQYKSNGGAFDLKEMERVTALVEGDYVEGRVDSTEAETVLSYMGSIIGFEKSGEVSLPRDRESQLQVVRSVLDEIDLHKINPWDPIAGVPYLRALENYCKLPYLDKTIKQEVWARLHAIVMCNAFTEAQEKLGQSPSAIWAVIDRVRTTTDGKLISPEDMHFYYRGGENRGLSKAISEAWGKFEDINNGEGKRPGYGAYNDIFTDMLDARFLNEQGIERAMVLDWMKTAGMGLAVTEVDSGGMWIDGFNNYYLDKNEKRVEAVQAFIAYSIRKNNPEITEYEAKKGAEYAWKVQVGTGRAARYNLNFSGPADWSQIMLTKLASLDDHSKGKSAGEWVMARNMISLCPDYMGYITDTTIFAKLYAKDIPVELAQSGGVKPMDYFYGKGILSSYIETVWNTIKSEYSTPEDISKADIGGLYAKFNKVAGMPMIILNKEGKPIVKKEFKQKDQNGHDVLVAADEVDNKGRPTKVTTAAKAERAERARALWVAEVMQSAVTNINLRWTRAAMLRFRQKLLEPIQVSESTGESKGFVSTLTSSKDTLKPGKVVYFISKDVLAELEKAFLGSVGDLPGGSIYPKLLDVEKANEGIDKLELFKGGVDTLLDVQV